MINREKSDMNVKAIRVIESTNGMAVLGGSSCELVRFFDDLATSREVQKLGEQQGVDGDQLRALSMESARLLTLVRPLHVVKKAA